MDNSIVKNVVAQLNSGSSCSLIGIEGMGQDVYAEEVFSRFKDVKAIIIDIQMFPYLSGDDLLQNLNSQLMKISDNKSKSLIVNDNIVELIRKISKEEKLIIIFNGLSKLSEEPTSLFNYLAGLVRISDGNLSYCFVDNSSIFHELPLEKSGNLSPYIFHCVEYIHFNQELFENLTGPALEAFLYNLVSSLSVEQKDSLVAMLNGDHVRVDNVLENIGLVKDSKLTINSLEKYLLGEIQIEPVEKYLDIKNGSLYIVGDKKEIEFTTAELDILGLLLEHQGETVSKDQISEVLWGDESTEKYSEWALSQYIFRIRKKLERFDIDPIKSVRGKGYKLVC